eukprot:GHVT01006308.1.p1 GENE.GHVT01006308.1~~GHVT01006308.1.p1  ORF type:complete len:197 (-),score=38.46 GHVT01006308.1:310-900(-)
MGAGRRLQSNLVAQAAGAAVPQADVSPAVADEADSSASDSLAGASPAADPSVGSTVPDADGAAPESPPLEGKASVARELVGPDIAVELAGAVGTETPPAARPDSHKVPPPSSDPQADITTTAQYPPLQPASPPKPQEDQVPSSNPHERFFFIQIYQTLSPIVFIHLRDVLGYSLYTTYVCLLGSLLRCCQRWLLGA